MDEQQDFGSRLESLSLDILGKVSDRFITNTATSAQPTAPADSMALAIPSATNQSIGFLRQYKTYLIAGVLGLVVILFFWKKGK